MGRGGALSLLTDQLEWKRFKSKKDKKKEQQKKGIIQEEKVNTELGDSGDSKLRLPKLSHNSFPFPGVWYK